ncbi:hypothetical protein ACPV47_24440 [Vibrio jasicida]|uniref:hypothetical protein n=1 Tax=Vibrio jasicida TaxID=766224 RepID=UPI004068D463
MKKIILLISALLTISINVSALEKTIVVTTNIDTNNLYTDAITSVEFMPSVLDLSLKNDKSGFENTQTTMKISTDIPMGVSAVSYIATLSKNESNCIDFSGNTNPQTDFVTVTFDGYAINIGDSVNMTDFNSNDGSFKYSEHDVVLVFKPFDSIVSIGSPEECSGEVEFSVGVDI